MTPLVTFRSQGLRVGDMILSINGKEVNDRQQAMEVLDASGSFADVVYTRKDDGGENAAAVGATNQEGGGESAGTVATGQKSLLGRVNPGQLAASLARTVLQR